ncbi:hypothetical protein CU102_26425 [Phyllobacterium brassicacearum]|uniref:Uncharacterized protein n=1 Tax=Phyllobacterium brassicacearum TaxID=314235 RepID=A0A2P7B5I1_9HYPH|nr:hypothetical protein [Phyllobacterium brassicacearum]PSH61721.1 hypothetical protein CU102_26425 [Phyllobacterium brassicacearum]TDQ15325.1 hypothetical protein DEV91_13438 [Phyllobacterium brassicacearum]
MAPENKPSARQLYLDGLRELAARHGDEYALLTAATTMANLLAMVSMAMYHLSDPPLFLPPEAPPAKGEKH